MRDSRTFMSTNSLHTNSLRSHFMDETQRNHRRPHLTSAGSWMLLSPFSPCSMLNSAAVRSMNLKARKATARSNGSGLLEKKTHKVRLTARRRKVTWFENPLCPVVSYLSTPPSLGDDALVPLIMGSGLDSEGFTTVRPSSARARDFTSRMVPVYPTSCRYLRVHKSNTPHLPSPKFSGQNQMNCEIN